MFKILLLKLALLLGPWAPPQKPDAPKKPCVYAESPDGRLVRRCG